MASFIPTPSSSFIILSFFAFLLFAQSPFAVEPPDYSPSPLPDYVSQMPEPPSPTPSLSLSPSPALSPEIPSPSPAPPVPLSPEVPSPSPALPVPPSPSPPAPPSDLAPDSPSPAPAPGDSAADGENSPSPAPVVTGDVRHEDQSSAGDLNADDSSPGGMSEGKKAGVTVGVIAAAGFVVLGAMVYRKRQRNIRRAQYGYSARRDLL